MKVAGDTEGVRLAARAYCKARQVGNLDSNQTGDLTNELRVLDTSERTAGCIAAEGAG